MGYSEFILTMVLCREKCGRSRLYLPSLPKPVGAMTECKVWRRLMIFLFHCNMFIVYILFTSINGFGQLEEHHQRCTVAAARHCFGIALSLFGEG